MVAKTKGTKRDKKKASLGYLEGKGEGPSKKMSLIPWTFDSFASYIGVASLFISFYIYLAQTISYSLVV